MRPNWLRSITRDPSVSGRSWRRGTLLAGFVGGAIAWGAAGITITVDCPSCGPGQTFPHLCPQDQKATTPGPGANALPAFVDEARKQQRRLAGISGLDIPDLGEARTLGELDASLDRLIAATKAEIERCELERAEFVRKSATAGAERARLAQLAIQLAAQIEQMRREIGESEGEAIALIREATTARDETRQLQKSLAGIREEIRQVRNRLFPRLHRAANLGWILPPSNYRPMPGPSPVKASHDSVGKSNVAAPSLASTSSGADGAQSARPPGAAAVTSAKVGLRQDVESKLEQLPLLWERARTAVAARADAIRSLEVQRSESDVQSARLSALEPQRATLASQAATAKRNVTIARQTSIEYAARRAEARTAALYAWIEWGIFQLLDRKAEALFGEKEVSRTESTFLQAWGDVAATAVELGSDPRRVIVRLPAAMSTRGESLESLQRDLAGVREKFGLGFVTTNADKPAPITPYLTTTLR